jgi:hypothetical protein
MEARDARLSVTFMTAMLTLLGVISAVQFAHWCWLTR